MRLLEKRTEVENEIHRSDLKMTASEIVQNEYYYSVVVGTTEGFAPIKKLNKESLYPFPIKSLHKEQTSYLFNQAL